MQSNNISDVEIIIQKALTLERLSRTRESSRSTLNFSSQSLNNRSMTAGIQKPISPIQNFSQNPLIDSMRNSNSTTPFISPSQSGKNHSSTTSKESEMNV